jgi:O-antigen ligase
MPWYCGKDSPHLFFFGLNSLLEPATKRMLGTLGNPNNNAILFLFFTVWYFPKKKWTVKEIVFFFLSVIAVCSCQSRTGIIAFVVVFLLNYIFTKIKWWKIILQSIAVMIILLLFFTVNFLLDFLLDFSFFKQNKLTEKIENRDYVLSLVDGNAFSGNSWTVRLKIWKELSVQTLEKPIIGHAPQKNYFYQKKLYAENEYVLMAWRYGFSGLIFYLLIFLIPLKDSFRFARSQLEARRMLLLIVVFLITAITNVPLSNTILSVLFFGYLGIFYSQKERKNDEILA